MRRIILAAAIAIATLPPVPASAQLFGTPNWVTTTILSDTIAVAFRDSSTVLDMSQHRYLTLHIKVWPPATGEPWANVALKCICSTRSRPDSSSSTVVRLQPVADHSYFASAAGDSLAYGTWSTVGPLELAPGEILIRGQRSSTQYSYPSGFTFTLDNKGQGARCRNYYFHARTLATGSGGAARVEIQATRSN